MKIAKINLSYFSEEPKTNFNRENIKKIHLWISLRNQCPNQFQQNLTQEEITQEST